MAINKVVYGNNTLMDITDTTASAGDVLNGQVFYAANGTRTVGTGATTDVQINGTSITSNSVANIATQGTYNASTNKIATISDLPTKTSDLTNDSNFITGMFIASYGSSTYAEVLDAYQKNKVIYCRASSNSNPATGNQLRLAFLAYVNNQTTPTEFEFQYYRSVSSHSASQQGDQVYVYKINSSGTWSVTTREAYTKIATSTGLSNSYSNGTMTLTSDVSDIKINNTSVVSSNVANIATEGTYNATSNKIATMSDVSSALSGYVEKSSSSQNETGLTGWDYDSGLIYETRITDNNGDKYINITPSGNKMSVSNGTRNNYLEVGNQYISLTASNINDEYPVNTTFTTNGGVTTLTTQGPDGTGSLDIYSSDSLSLTKANGDNSVSSTVSLRNNSITLYSDTVEVKQAPTTNLGVANKKYVDDAITALPEPMIFKGSLGTGGTITSLPAASSSNEGFTYKVITAGTYASQSAKVGDTFISDGTAWVLIPSGDEPSGTVTSVTLKATSPISIDSNSAITTSGTRTLSHANSGVTAGTYKSVTVNATGHVTAGTNPTTISGYGITDAKIANGVITLGSNTITPLTSSSTLDASKLTGTVPSGCYTNNDIQINGTSIVSSGVANIVTNTAYNASSNKIATMTDLSSYVNKSTSSSYSTGLTGWDYDGDIFYETRISSSSGDSYFNVSSSTINMGAPGGAGVGFGNGSAYLYGDSGVELEGDTHIYGGLIAGTTGDGDVTLHGLVAPTNNDDPATKGYVDTIVGNIETLLGGI